jgi:ribose 5-phosphate isomerase RpiB
MAETIPIGADHAGYHLKERLKAELRTLGYDALDVGTSSEESVDYPDFAHRVASQVEDGAARRGVLLCGTGLGMSYAANRHHGVRASRRRPRSPGWPASTTTPTSWCCRRATSAMSRAWRFSGPG